MNEGCPNCGQLTNAPCARLIEDSCGHKKCRICLLYEEQGCKTCEREKNGYLQIEGESLKVERIDDNNGESSSLITILDISNAHCVKLINKSNEHDVQLMQQRQISINSNPSSIDNNNTNNNNNNTIDHSIINSVNKNVIKSFDVDIGIDDDEKLRPKKALDRSHIVIVPGNPERYKCNLCGKIFRNKKGKCYHDVCVTGIQPYHCSICDRSFVKKSHFEYHERVHTGYKPFKCELCDKAFPQKNKLNRHMLSHSQEKLFLCTECDKRYSKKEDLKAHMMIHTGSIPHVCKSCGKAFRLRTNLNRHMHIHSNERPYVCDFCGKSFKDKSLLSRHKRTHGKERPYSCAHCTRVFLSKAEVRRHLTIHSDVKPFNCTICQTVFRRKDNLNRHMRHHHSGESSCDMNNLKRRRNVGRKEKSRRKRIDKINVNNINNNNNMNDNVNVNNSVNINNNINNINNNSSDNDNKNVAIKSKTTAAKKMNNLSLQKNLSKENGCVGGEKQPINSRIDSMGNILPVIRAPGELSNAVSVINGPISKLRSDDNSTSSSVVDGIDVGKKHVLTYTAPIPRAEALFINQRIEEKLYHQSVANSTCFFRDCSSRLDGHLSIPILPPLRHNSPVRAVPNHKSTVAEKLKDTNFSPPKNGTLIELKNSIASNSIMYNIGGLDKVSGASDDSNAVGVQIDDQSRGKCCVNEQTIDLTIKSNGIHGEELMPIERTNCVATIKNSVYLTGSSSNFVSGASDSGGDNNFINTTTKNFEMHWRRRTAEILKPHLN